jgi:hypothetical protein
VKNVVVAQEIVQRKDVIVQLKTTKLFVEMVKITKMLAWQNVQELRMLQLENVIVSENKFF